MCGFVGILGPDFAERRALLRRMLDAIAHRGPDGEGIHEDGHLALGHRRLAIFDPSEAAAQPMRHPDSGHVLAFNGAIYNYRELRPTLRDAPRSSGDTEVLLRTLVEKGADALGTLNGMWAFALWDPRQRRLLLSRDRLGVKPLYWRRWRDHLAFASEPAALLALDADAPRLNPDAFATFLIDRTLDHGPDTFFADIHQLPPASRVLIDADHLPEAPQPDVFWRPFAHDGAHAGGPRDPDDADALRALLDDAVALRMRADVSGAYLLSGGLDSSSILASAARRTPERTLSAYTLRYDDPSDESALAAATAAHLGNVKLHHVEPGGTDLADELDELIRIQGEPFADGSMLAHRLLMRRVAGDGHKVVIGGLGGDEALGGYVGPYLNARAADLLASGHARAAHAVTGGRWRGLLAAGAHLPPVALRNRLRRRLQAHRLGAWLRPGLLDHVADRYLPERQDGRFGAYLRAGLVQWALPGFTHYEDRNAMRHGLEARAPFLDYRLVEWGLSRPPEALVGDGLGKRVLRAAMRARLPEAVVARRDKQGLPAPAARWLRAHPELVDHGLDSPLLGHWLDTARIRRHFQQSLDGSRALSATEADVLWRAVIAGHWARLFGVRG